MVFSCLTRHVEQQQLTAIGDCTVFAILLQALQPFGETSLNPAFTRISLPCDTQPATSAWSTHTHTQATARQAPTCSHHWMKGRLCSRGRCRLMAGQERLAQSPSTRIPSQELSNPLPIKETILNNRHRVLSVMRLPAPVAHSEVRQCWPR